MQRRTSSRRPAPAAGRRGQTRWTQPDRPAVAGSGAVPCPASTPCRCSAAPLAVAPRRAAAPTAPGSPQLRRRGSRRPPPRPSDRRRRRAGSARPAARAPSDGGRGRRPQPARPADRGARARRLRPAPHRRRACRCCGSTVSCAPMEDQPSLHAAGASSACCTPSLTQKQREKFEENLELDFAYSVPGQGPLPRQHLPPARRARRGVPADPVRDQAARGPRRPAGGRELRDAAARLRARHRPDRLRQVDDAGRARRPGQPHRGATTS